MTPRTYRRVCLVALWALAAIVVTGAAVRLTGSGLGCSDWPACENDRLVAPMQFHAMVEFVNRLITGIVSVSVIIAVAGSLVRRPRRSDLTRWSLGLVVGVVAQIIIGGVVTLSDLTYSVVAIHFLVSMVLVWAATVLLDRSGRPDDDPRRGQWPAWAKLIVALAVGVLLTGPLVTSAGPHAGDPDVKRLPLDLSWAARIHSAAVWAFVAAIAVTAFRLRGDNVQRRRVMDVLFASIAQGAVGYLQYFTGVPPLLVLLHVAGATVVWVMTVRLALGSAASPRPATEVAERVRA